jgi:hypothetical protein
MLAIFKKRLTLNTCFNTCNEVVLSAFIKAIVKQDYSGLIKSGSPSENELSTAWDKVFNEYLTISGDTHISTLLALLKSIAILKSKIILVEIIVNEMAAQHNPCLAEHLRSYGFRFQYEDGPELRRELEITITQSKALLLLLQQDEAELTELRKDEDSAATEQDYQSQLSALEEFKGHSINEDTYTVARYCADIKRMKLRYQTKAA